MVTLGVSEISERFRGFFKGPPAWKTLVGSSRLTHAIVCDEASLEALESEWGDLFARASRPTPFLRYSWVRSCWDRHRSSREARLFIVVVRRDDRPVLIAPMVRRENQLSFLDSFTPQYNDVLVEDSGEKSLYVDYLWHILTSVRDVRRFVSKWVRDDSLLAPYLARAHNFEKAISYGAPFIDLEEFEDWTAYLNSLSKSLRLDHGRQLRNLSKRGELTFHLSTESTCCSDVAWLFARKRQWLETKGKRSRWLRAAGTEEFFAAAAKEGIDARRTWLTVLSLDGDIIAAMLNFREDATLYVSKTAYDPSWQVYSPSRTLFLLTIERAFEARLSKVDLMIGHYPPKDKLATGRIKVRNRVSRL